MHRTKTHFAARVNHVATELEKRGIRATYRLHDSVLSNRASRRHFTRAVPSLDDVQTRIVGELDADGYSVVSFSELFPEDGSWGSIDEQAKTFVATTEAGLASDQESLRVHAGKEFVVRMHSVGAELSPDDSWFATCTSRRMLDIANTYLGLWSKIEYVDLWYSVPQPADASRRASQRWHRDFNDKHLLKAFLYLVDVDENTGPFQYVPGSAAGGSFDDVWPWHPMSNYYPADGWFEDRLPPDRVQTFTGAAGTLLFCNTSGFHRGGFATEKARVLATSTYCSPASLAALTERNFRYTGSLDELDDVTRFAVT